MHLLREESQRRSEREHKKIMVGKRNGIITAWHPAADDCSEKSHVVEKKEVEKKNTVRWQLIVIYPGKCLQLYRGEKDCRWRKKRAPRLREVSVR